MRGQVAPPESSARRRVASARRLRRGDSRRQCPAPRGCGAPHGADPAGPGRDASVTRAGSRDAVRRRLPRSPIHVEVPRPRRDGLFVRGGHRHPLRHAMAANHLLDRLPRDAEKSGRLGSILPLEGEALIEEKLPHLIDHLREGCVSHGRSDVWSEGGTRPTRFGEYGPRLLGGGAVRQEDPHPQPSELKSVEGAQVVPPCDQHGGGRPGGQGLESAIPVRRRQRTNIEHRAVERPSSKLGFDRSKRADATSSDAVAP